MMSKKPPLPKLLITKQAVHDLRAEALRFLTNETGAGLFGLIYTQAGKTETVAITGVIPAPAADIVRRVATVSLSGNKMSEAVDWLEKNHAAIHGAANGVEFAFLYYAHSHHKMDFRHFSGRDIQSMYEAIHKHGMKLAVGVLMLITEEWEKIHTKDSMEGTISIEVDTRVHLRFYYLDRVMVDAGIREPTLIRPEVVDGKSLPVVPPLSWEYTNEDEFLLQMRKLERQGARVTVIKGNFDSDPVLEIKFIISKPTWQGKVLLITTDWNFPASPARVEVIRPGAGIKPLSTDKAGAPIWMVNDDFLDVMLRFEELESL